jgi:hypothetical protein
MMQKREHLLHYMMKGNVHLSKKDYGFFNNLTYIIKDKNKVTSNQNKLFEKLIYKYQRQLRKLNVNIEKVLELNWDAEIVDSLEEYLVPKIYLEGDVICLRTPFNSKFIQSIKSNKDNTFVWVPEYKVYRSKFYTHSLRLAVDLCDKFFAKVEYCDTLKEMLLPFLNDKHATKAPILTVNEGKYYINNMNESLNNAVQDIELNDDPNTLYALSRYGISVSDDIIKNDQFLSFASQYVVKIDMDDLLKNPEYLTKLGVKDVCFAIGHVVNSGADKELLAFLKQNNITVHSKLDTIVDGTLFIKRVISNNFANPLGGAYKKISKIVLLMNSRPINIK